MQKQGHTANSIESLNMALTALKSLLSEYAIRAQHAEQAAGVLMRDKLPDEKLRELAALVSEQIDVRSKERAVHQQAVMQATLVALTHACKLDDAAMRHEVNNVVVELTRSLSIMNQP